MPDYLTLSALNSLIKDSLTLAFPDRLWVVAEVSEARCNSNGHCYLDLVETSNGKRVAQMRATIWAARYRELSRKFSEQTGETINQGLSILFLASVKFHEVYGLSLDIADIDPSYSLGDLAKKKKETIDRLKKEGLWDLNRTKDLPLVIQSIAVVSSPTAAGYHDFCSCLKRNPFQYRFRYQLFPAVVQGTEAVASIPDALKQVADQAGRFDAIVIVRGGGSQLDLSCFDTYEVARAVALSPLPVITGIGHERDDTVSDMVACIRQGQPRAAAEFIIGRARDFEIALNDLLSRISHTATRVIQSQNNNLELITTSLRRYSTDCFKQAGVNINTLIRKIVICAREATGQNRERLLQLEHSIPLLCRSAIASGSIRVNYMAQKVANLAKTALSDLSHSLERIESRVNDLDPVNILKRGYSITLHNGKVIKSVEGLMVGYTITTRLYQGEISSVVESVEGKKGE